MSTTNRLYRKTLIILIASFFIYCKVSFAEQYEKSNNNRRMNQLSQRIKVLELALASSVDKRLTLNNARKQTDIEIASISTHIKNLNQNLKVQTGRLHEAEIKAKTTQREFDEESSLLAQQIRAAYALGNESYVKMILNHENPNTFSRSMNYYHYLNQARVESIEKVKHLALSLETDRQYIKTNRDHLQILKREQQEKQLQLKQAKKDQASIIKRLNSDIDSKKQTLDSLIANKKALEKVIVSLNQDQGYQGYAHQPFLAARGKLPWPTKGIITQHFGANLGESHLHFSGVLIKAPRNQAIYAIHDGRVVFANGLRGFGLLLIIEHDGGYMSLYAQNNALYKRTGDIVHGGELIALVGNSGRKGQSGLYFEIRNKGKPQNPELWCKNKNLSA